MCGIACCVVGPAGARDRARLPSEDTLMVDHDPWGSRHRFDWRHVESRHCLPRWTSGAQLREVECRLVSWKSELHKQEQQGTTCEGWTPILIVRWYLDVSNGLLKFEWLVILESVGRFHRPTGGHKGWCECDDKSFSGDNGVIAQWSCDKEIEIDTDSRETDHYNHIETW